MIYSKTPTLNIEGNDIERLINFITTDEDKNVILNEIGLRAEGDSYAVVHEHTLELPEQVTQLSHSHEYCDKNISEYLLIQYRSGEIHQYEIYE